MIFLFDLPVKSLTVSSSLVKRGTHEQYRQRRRGRQGVAKELMEREVPLPSLWDEHETPSAFHPSYLSVMHAHPSSSSCLHVVCRTVIGKTGLLKRERYSHRFHAQLTMTTQRERERERDQREFTKRIMCPRDTQRQVVKQAKQNGRKPKTNDTTSKQEAACQREKLG